MSRHAFCREICLERGEPLVGTGVVARRILLLRWPRGKWRAPRWEAAGMSAALGAALVEANEAGGNFIALVDRTGETDAVPQLQCWPEGISASYESEAALVAAIRDWGRGTPLQGAKEERIAILTCTDSRRDACCARFGFATFKALKEAADPARFQLLQSTHIGGCRFAASLMVLPRRERYGRLSPAEVPAFLEAIEEEEVYLPAFRGRADLPESVQVAEAAAFAWADAHGVARREVRVEDADAPREPTPGARQTLIAHAGYNRLCLELAAEVFTVQANCGDVAAGERLLKPRWRVVAVDRQLSRAESCRPDQSGRSPATC